MCSFSVTEYKRKLIEVALPLEAINKESAREKSIRHGHPSTLHLWWARRPLATCRAVLFASLVDDPSAHPREFPTEADQDAERQRLFAIIEDLVKWENSNNPRVLAAARAEIARSCNGNAPPVLDPFCGGGSIPLEAQRLGLKVYASDLNPVAVLITKVLVDIPARFAGRRPVNPAARLSPLGQWTGSQGLAEDVSHYGGWLRDEAARRIGHLYPKVKLPREHGGGEAAVIAWLWARTVRCPNPACGRMTPLLSSFVLSSKPGRTTYLVPRVDGTEITFSLSATIPSRLGDPTKGFKRGMSGIFACAVCGTVTTRDYVAAEGIAGRLGRVPTAIVAEGHRSRVYMPPDAASIPAVTRPQVGGLDVPLAANPRDLWCRNFGLLTFDQLFTDRQLVALTTFSDLVNEARQHVFADAVMAGMRPDGAGVAADGSQADAYADSVATYLALAVSRLADYASTLTTWASNPQMEILRNSFARQALPMTWDFAEGNVFGPSSGSIEILLDAITRSVQRLGLGPVAKVTQRDAMQPRGVSGTMTSTDPPYYDNIGYADVADFFYVWLRKSLSGIYPDIFATLLTPKSEELVAIPYRFGGSRSKADKHFETGLAAAFSQMKGSQAEEFPMTVFYAFKQAETESASGALISTGWETMLEGLLREGLAIRGTWPMRSERGGRMVSIGTNALASSIVLVCRPRRPNAPLASRKEFVTALKEELPESLHRLQQGNIAPVDLAQAAIGPGMSVFSRYAKVIEADGSSMSVRTALGIVNQVLDETLAQQEGDFDPDTRWAVAWFEQFAMRPGDYGVAETLSKAKNSAVNALVEAGIVEAGSGKVRLLERDELPADWNPAADRRLTVWEVAQHLIRALETGGESAAAELAGRVGGLGETARELAYRLYNICERKRWAKEALSYNGLVVAWPGILRLASEQSGQAVQMSLGG